MTQEEKAKLLGRLQALCSKKECCSSEIRRKALLALDGDGSAAEEIVSELVRDGFIDDSRYAAAFAREKSSLTGWGPVKIRYALAAKGIGAETARAALEEVDGDKAGARLDKLLEAKWKTLEGDPQAKYKLLRFALTRGYEYSDIEEKVDRLSKKKENS